MKGQNVDVKDLISLLLGSSPHYDFSEKNNDEEFLEQFSTYFNEVHNGYLNIEDLLADTMCFVETSDRDKSAFRFGSLSNSIVEQ